MHARGVDVLFRDVTIRIQLRGYDQGRAWRHAPEAWTGMWKVGYLSSASEEEDWFSQARRGVGCVRGLGQMEKSGVSLSLCRKTFKLKGNKKFGTWTKKS